MKRDLQKIFGQLHDKPKFTGTVAQARGRRHVVIDDLGKQYTVDSATVYRPGARVIVMNGVIVGRAAAGREPKVIEV